MTPERKEPKAHPMNLLPHQIALVDTVFSPESKRVVLLRGDVGLGKSAALVALVTRLRHEQPTARALLFLPAGLRVHFSEMLKDAGTPALILDRYRFREVLDSTTGRDLWPTGAVILVSQEFARQPDIQNSLAETRWDLVIADETHLIRGMRAKALQRIAASAGRIVFATLPGLETPDGFSADSATIVEWRRDQVVDRDGKPFSAPPRPLLHEVSFSRSPAESSLLGTLRDLSRTFDIGIPSQVLVAKSLLRTVQSSPAAIETALQRLVERLQTKDDLGASLDGLEEEVFEEGSAGQISRPTAETLTRLAACALQEIEALGGDSKLSAFSALLTRLTQVTGPPIRILVLTEYVGTLYYLAAEIEGRGMACQLLHGGMDMDERHRSLQLFSETGGILVATLAAMWGFELSQVTDLVLYDIPGSKTALYVALSRVERFGRVKQLHVHVLVPTTTADTSTSEPLGLLREILGLTEAQPTH